VRGGCQEKREKRREKGEKEERERRKDGKEEKSRYLTPVPISRKPDFLPFSTFSFLFSLFLLPGRQNQGAFEAYGLQTLHGAEEGGLGNIDGHHLVISPNQFKVGGVKTVGN
jgi:hypothetical protein